MHATLSGCFAVQRVHSLQCGSDKDALPCSSRFQFPEVIIQSRDISLTFCRFARKAVFIQLLLEKFCVDEYYPLNQRNYVPYASLRQADFPP